MDYLFLNSEYKDDVKLTKSALDFCKKYKTIAIYSSIQFSNKLNDVIKQLQKEKINVISSKPERTTSKYQLLGCDLSYKNLKLKEIPDIFLYIGDGNYHPMTLALLQKDKSKFKEILQFNPFNQKYSIFTLEDVKAILKKYRANLIKFLDAGIIGVIVTTKQGQQQYLPSKKLEKIYNDKRFYYFLGDTIHINKTENFPFVRCWVNTACPRVGFDDSLLTSIPMININDAMNAKEILSEENLLTIK